VPSLRDGRADVALVLTPFDERGLDSGALVTELVWFRLSESRSSAVAAFVRTAREIAAAATPAPELDPAPVVKCDMRIRRATAVRDNQKYLPTRQVLQNPDAAAACIARGILSISAPLGLSSAVQQHGN